MFDKFALLQRWIVCYVVRKLAMISRSYCATFDKFPKTNIKYFHRKRLLSWWTTYFRSDWPSRCRNLNFLLRGKVYFVLDEFLYITLCRICMHPTLIFLRVVTQNTKFYPNLYYNDTCVKLTCCQSVCLHL